MAYFNCSLLSRDVLLGGGVVVVVVVVVVVITDVRSL